MSNISVDDSVFKEQEQASIIKNDENLWVPDKAKKSYHEQRLGQSKWAFRLSFWGGIIGFCVIIWSVKRGIDSGEVEWIGIVAGAVMEGVSAIFYTLSNKANEKISEFFEKLTVDSNTKDAIKLAEMVRNDDIRDELLVKLSLHLSGIDDEKICKNVREICNKQE